MKFFPKNKQSWACGLSGQTVWNSKCVYTFGHAFHSKLINAQRCTYFPSNLSLPSFVLCSVCPAHTLSSNFVRRLDKISSVRGWTVQWIQLACQIPHEDCDLRLGNTSNGATNFSHFSISSSGKGDHIGMEHFTRAREGKGLNTLKTESSTILFVPKQTKPSCWNMMRRCQIDARSKCPLWGIPDI